LTLRPGLRLGPYEILSAIGAGAMGEVYRARDSRLGREAAIKVLPPAFSADPESLRRFEQEARAASALNHPNIVTVYEIGSADSVSFIAMELVDGKNLRELLANGPLPLRKTLEIGGQIADGLAAAHARGLVHRDLKPQNVMVSREGRVKILDFGLAKQVHTASLPAGEEEPRTDRSLTTPGTILGTVGYMSPEQARGEPADFRSDQFSLGVVLYEMASGRKAFEQGSAIETLSAILRDEPAPLASDASLPAPFCWIVERCLVKEPEGRYASTEDLAWDIKSLWGHLSSSTSANLRVPEEPRRRSAVGLLGWIAAVALAAGLGGVVATRWRRPAPSPSFEQLTFRRGSVWSARFAPDGRSVIYGAAWDGEPFRLFRKEAHGAASRLLEFPDANLLAVSRSGELAASVRCLPVLPGGATRGTLALAQLEGGAPREIENDVLFADFTPDGRELAVVRQEGGKTILEFPAGRKVYETDGLVTFPRVSPRGDLVAFLDHPTRIDDRGTVAVVDRAGKKRTLSQEWATEQGLAWHPTREEIWFSGAPQKEGHAIYALTLSGKSRVVARGPGDLTLLDIAADGRALISRESWRIGIVAHPSGGAERDVSWLDFSLLTDLSDDGRRLLFTQFGPSVDTAYQGYLRRVEERSPMLLGAGFAQALSPDGNRVLAIVPSAPPQLVLRPTGAGAGGPHPIAPRGLELIVWADWFPDGRRIAVVGTEPGHGLRLYACDPDSGETRAITPEGILLDHFQGVPISSDGKRLAAVLSDGRLAIFSDDGGVGRPVPNLTPGAVPIAWTEDDRRLYAYRLHGYPGRILRLDPETGQVETWKELFVSDPVGVHGFPSVRVTSDGTSYAYSYFRALSELFAVDGLR
jgi:dipeptidyl aminopeptidase/acylaminoacyl peptidase